MTGYHEYRYWSPLHDADMVRLTVFDQRGAEYWSLVPASAPRKYRERREHALKLIDYAMEQKMEPGQVVEA